MFILSWHKFSETFIYDKMQFKRCYIQELFFSRFFLSNLLLYISNVLSINETANFICYNCVMDTSIICIHQSIQLFVYNNCYDDTNTVICFGALNYTNIQEPCLLKKYEVSSLTCRKCLLSTICIVMSVTDLYLYPYAHKCWDFFLLYV